MRENVDLLVEGNVAVETGVEQPTGSQRPLRIMFLHTTRDESNEYKVHQLLAESADPERVDAMFFWQAKTHLPQENVYPDLPRPNRVFHHDFGRNMTKPNLPSPLMRTVQVMLNLPLAVWRIARQIRQFKPDMLYTSQQHHEVMLANILSKLFGIPHVIHVSYQVGPWLGRQTLKTIVNNPYVIGCSEFVRQSAIDAGAAAEHVACLHHIADLDYYDVPQNPAYIRDELGLALDTPVIAAAARLDQNKGFISLLEAFKLVLEDVPEAVLLIMGESSPGTHFDEVIYEKARALNLTDRVYFLGYRTDLAQILAGSTVFALPTKNDALPLVFLGAMVAGVPCVSVNSGGIPEMVVHGQTGFLSEVNDHEGLANHLIQLLENPALAKQMGRRGRERADRHFGKAVIIDKWLGLLSSWFEDRTRSG